MPTNRTGSATFIHSPYSQGPGASGLGALQSRRAHSHAAREAHAHVRRQRLVEYQATRAREEEKERLARATEVEAASPSWFLLGSWGRAEETPSGVLPGASIIPRNSFWITNLASQFVRLAFVNSNSLAGLFLVACRHLSQYSSQVMPHELPHFIQLTLQYKVACTQALREAIACLDIQSSISDWVVGLALFLAQDEVLTGDVNFTQKHIQGAIQMTKHNGALNKTDLDVFPYDLIRREMTDSAR
ncbi:uncharacterized protein PG986_006703 [Apiospora aurea]|uniref:Uncharacterized protein n=1 Tax=Apiospora aurea TaxID=335848 RepID=A0ABR1QAG3_9PEZI